MHSTHAPIPSTTRWKLLCLSGDSIPCHSVPRNRKRVQWAAFSWLILGYTALQHGNPALHWNAACSRCADQLLYVVRMRTNLSAGPWRHRPTRPGLDTRPSSQLRGSAPAVPGIDATAAEQSTATLVSQRWPSARDITTSSCAAASPCRTVPTKQRKVNTQQVPHLYLYFCESFANLSSVPRGTAAAVAQQSGHWLVCKPSPGVRRGAPRVYPSVVRQSK